VNSVWFLLSTGQFAIGSKGNSAISCSMVKVVVVFTRQQLHCPISAIVFGKLLPQQGGAIQF
jgi:hypothetical protein